MLHLTHRNPFTSISSSTAGPDRPPGPAPFASPFPTYPGGKGTCYQHLINLMPPHTKYIETHLGGGAVLVNKRPAQINIGVDIDPDVISAWHDAVPTAYLDVGIFWFIREDAVALLQDEHRRGKLNADTLVYCDPPYLMTTRRRPTPRYRYEYTVSDHIALLQTLKTLNCHVMISGYDNELYDHHLAGWHKEKFTSVTRAGTRATETVWMNYPPPTTLHDYRYLGENFRERERIKRKIARWKAKLQRMDELEKQALLAALNGEDNP